MGSTPGWKGLQACHHFAYHEEDFSPSIVRIVVPSTGEDDQLPSGTPVTFARCLPRALRTVKSVILLAKESSDKRNRPEQTAGYRLQPTADSLESAAYYCRTGTSALDP